LIVGSITTGYFRLGSASQPASARTVTVSREPVCVTDWLTLSLNVFPTGEVASGAASVMNGRGITYSGSPSPLARRNAIDPSRS